MAAPSQTTPVLREGRFPELWGSIVGWSLLAAMGLACRDLGLFYASHSQDLSFQPNLPVWVLYLLSQLANKVPVSYRYQARGAPAIMDIGGFAAGMLAVLLFALQIPAGQILGVSLFSVVCVWLAAGLAMQLRSSEPQISLGRRAWCAVFAFLFPSLPMLGASMVLAAA